jgi:hypothetical protein
VVLVAYIIYTTSTLPTMVHKRLASPSTQASARKITSDR